MGELFIKCHLCRKKIFIVKSLKCKCNSTFCFDCKGPEIHLCDYDYIQNNKEKLKLILKKVEIEKIIKL